MFTAPADVTTYTQSPDEHLVRNLWFRRDSFEREAEAEAEAEAEVKICIFFRLA